MDIIPVIPLGKNPVPTLPNQVNVTAPKVQPGSVSTSAPNVPQATPPNVNGGPASFSSLTQSLKDLVDSKTAQLDSEAKAVTANASVDQSASTVVNAASDDALKAYMHIQKASTLPGGAKGGLARILGLFDSDFNMDYQTTQVEISTQKSAMAAATAQALKTQNNALPALLGKVAEATKVVFDAQNDANKLVLEQGRLDQQIFANKIAKANLSISMSKEHREATEFAVRSMTSDQIEAELPKALAGKGKFAGLGGFLQDRLIAEKAAEVGLASSANALKAGNRKEYEESLTQVVKNIPLDVSKSLYEKAKAGGAMSVQIPGGPVDPATKKPGMVDIPFQIFEQGMIQAQETEDKVRTHQAADLNTRMDIGPKATNMFNTFNALAAVDPRATQLSTQLGSIMNRLDPKSPDSIYATGILLNSLETKRDEMIKDQAGKFHDAEAKAGVMNFGKTGKFDAQGGTAVTTESAGVPSLNRNGKFADFWQAFNRDIATQIQSEHQSGGSFGTQGQNGVVSVADAMTIFASQGNKGREKISTIAANLLADPIKAKEYSRMVQGTMRVDAINSTLVGLMHQKDADPIWTDINTHPGSYMNKDGQIDTNLIFRKLEQMTVRSGGKLNYSQQFLAGLNNYAVGANTSSAGDVSYTLQDHAAVGALFGDHPESDVAGHLHWELRTLAERHRKEMAERINDDVSGKTEKEALVHAGIVDTMAMDFMNPYGQMSVEGAEKLRKKTGFDINSVPSATGIGTVADTKAKFPGGH